MRRCVSQMGRVSRAQQNQLQHQHNVRMSVSQKRLMASKQMTIRDALNSAINEEIRRDDRVFVMGEEASNVQ